MKYQLQFKNKLIYISFGRNLIKKHHWLYKQLICKNQTMMTNSEKVFKELIKLSNGLHELES